MLEIRELRPLLAILNVRLHGPASQRARSCQRPLCDILALLGALAPIEMAHVVSNRD